MQNNDEFLKRLEALDKEFKNLSHKTTVKKDQIVSFGSIKMDKESGVKGAIYGKTYEIIGWESSGKSTVCLQTMSNVQAQGKRVLLIDSEHSFDKTYAEKLGMNLKTEQFKLIQPDFAEEAFDYAIAAARGGLFDMIIFDSQTALIPKKGFEGDTGDSVLGLKSRLMSAEVPKLINLCAKNNILLFFVSQFRHAIGVMFGSPETTNGGNALKFYCHARIELRKSAKPEEGLNLTKFKFIKNKLAKPYGSGSFNIIWGKGIDNREELIDIAIESEIIKKAGSWFSYGDLKIGQGIDTVKTLLNDNPELLEEIKNKIFNIDTTEKL